MPLPKAVKENAHRILFLGEENWNKLKNIAYQITNNTKKKIQRKSDSLKDMYMIKRNFNFFILI